MTRAAVAMLSLLATLLIAAASYAAVPNDDQATATEIVPPFPYFGFPDLNEATTSPAEFQQCGASQTNAVWYKYTAGAVDEVLLYNFQPFSAASELMISENAGPCFVPVQTELRAFQLPAGETVYLSVGALIGNPLVVVSIYADVRPLTHIDVTLNPKGAVTKAGYAQLTGTVACDYDEVVYVSVYMTQKSGHGFIEGSSATNANCGPSGAAPWFVEVQPNVPGSRFVAGQASVQVDAFCSAWAALCTTDFLPLAPVKLVVAK